MCQILLRMLYYIFIEGALLDGRIFQFWKVAFWNGKVLAVKFPQRHKVLFKVIFWSHCKLEIRYSIWWQQLKIRFLKRQLVVIIIYAGWLVSNRDGSTGCILNKRNVSIDEENLGEMLIYWKAFAKYFLIAAWFHNNCHIISSSLKFPLLHLFWSIHLSWKFWQR